MCLRIARREHRSVIGPLEKSEGYAIQRHDQSPSVRSAADVSLREPCGKSSRLWGSTIVLLGGGLARHALSRGFRVFGFDKTEPGADLLEAGLEVLANLEQLREAIEAPRRVFLYLPAGVLVDETLNSLSRILDRGDVAADGGNSYWGDSIGRHRRLKNAGIEFLDLGTSGGPSGALNGACFMVGGEREVVSRLEPVLKELAVPGGYVHAGGPGAGHFVKLVHNGIEFGMLQAIGEGRICWSAFERNCRQATFSTAGAMVR
jgi:6-phosphogluconate dehydrogenase (decarboxylating)